MSTYLRKCIDIAPSAVVSPHLDPANDYAKLVKQPWWPALRATTSWARFWADWPSLQRVAGQPPGFGDAAASLAALDRQIDAALADGMKIIMLPYRYPKWANETDTLVFGSEQDSAFFPQDRVTRLAQYLDWRAGLRARPGYKTYEYRMPPKGFGPGQAWSEFVTWLWDRYADRIAAFEVVNEPNGQLWPQRSTVDTDDINVRWGTEGSDLLTAPAVAEMMETVDALARSHPNPPLLLAPSCSDSLTVAPRTVTTNHKNPYTPSDDPFTESLVRALAARGFAGGERWVWAYHNYSDVERNYQHVVHLRRILAEGGWAGRRLDGGPEVWCTEGGCRIAVTNTRFAPTLGRDLTADERRAYQARVLTEALARHHYAKGAGAGVGMLTQYTTYADPNFDDGLLEAAAAGGAPRPALKAWCDVPEYHAAPAQRAAWRPQL
jgi:hypothetical protein